nr:hypothetical protein [Nanchangia anserum]
MHASSGTTMAEIAGAIVWAKKTSMRSMSVVKRASRSPERAPASAAGEAGMRRTKQARRSSSSARKATLWPRNCSA